MLVVFPGGAAGHWLSYAIWYLDNYSNTDIVCAPNYHSTALGRGCQVTHDYIANAPRLSSCYSFNLLLNGLLRDPQSLSFETWNEKFNSVSDSACFMFGAEWHQEYLRHIDIHWENLFVDRQKLTDEMSTVFNKQYDVEIVSRLAAGYCATVENPMNHVDNWDSVYWLGWCSGVLFANSIPAGIDYENCDSSDVKQALHKHRDFCLEFTEQYLLRTEDYK